MTVRAFWIKDSRFLTEDIVRDELKSIFMYQNHGLIFEPHSKEKPHVKRRESAVLAGLFTLLYSWRLKIGIFCEDKFV